MREMMHSPKFLHHFSVANMWIWALMIPLATWTRWIDSEAFISYLSIIALFLAAFGSYISSIVNSRQENGS